jgi:hypothetical protein
MIIQISIELNFFTVYRDFLQAPCKKSLLDVTNLTVAFTIGISKMRSLRWSKSLALHPPPLLLLPAAATIVKEDRCCCPLSSRTTITVKRFPSIDALTAEMVLLDQKLLEEWVHWRHNKSDNKYSGQINNPPLHICNAHEHKETQNNPTGTALSTTAAVPVGDTLGGRGREGRRGRGGPRGSF